MSARSNVAALLRAFNVTPVLEKLESLAFDVEVKAQRLAERLDPTVVDYSVSDWPDLQTWHDEVMRPQQEAMAAATERMLARMDPYPIEFEIPHAFVDWHDPAQVDLAGVKEAVRKAYEAGQPVPKVDMTSFTEAARRVKFEPFDTSDVQPFVDRINAFAADLARQQMDARERPMVEWLDDVGEVAGFDSETARQILRERES